MMKMLIHKYAIKIQMYIHVFADRPIVKLYRHSAWLTTLIEVINSFYIVGIVEMYFSETQLANSIFVTVAVFLN